MRRRDAVIVLGVLAAALAAPAQALASAPINAALPEITGDTADTATAGTLLTCSDGTWAPDLLLDPIHPETFTRKWQADGTDIAGATATTYTVASGDVGKLITCEVTAINTDDDPDTSTMAESLPVVAIAAPVTALAPVNISPPEITGDSTASTATVGTVLTCANGTWAGSVFDPTGFARKWRRGLSDISGATGTTYTVQAADVGQVITCLVTATNTAGSTDATSLPTAGLSADAPLSALKPINVVPPEITGDTSLSTATVGTPLTCTDGSWAPGIFADADGSYTRKWFRGLAEIAGATGTTYTVQEADIAQAITCQVTATNSADSTTATSLPTAGLSADAPLSALKPINVVLPEITGDTSLSTATPGTVLTCSDGTWAPGIFADSDGSYTRKWFRGLAEIAGATGTTYTVQAADVAQAISCQVTATNSADSTTATSLPVAGVTGIAAVAPVNVERPTITGTAQAGHTLTCSNGLWIGDPDSYAHRWERDGAPIAGATAATLLLGGADVGRPITCSVVAKKGSAESERVASGAVTPVAAPGVPANTGAPALSGKPWVGETLTCSNGSWSPEAADFAYSWRRDGQAIVDATAASYKVRDPDEGAELSCVVTAINSAGRTDAASAAVKAKKVVGGTDLPVNLVRPQVTGANRAGIPLTCSPGTWANGVTAYYYGWTRDGHRLKGETASTYRLQVEDAGHEITCYVAAHNESGQGVAGSVPLKISDLIVGQDDRRAPRITGLRIIRKASALLFRLNVSEDVVVTLVIERALDGYLKKAGGPCVRVTRSLKRRLARGFGTGLTAAERQRRLVEHLRERRCVIFKRSARHERGAERGPVEVAFKGKAGSRVLRPGRYRLVATATDRAGNDSEPRTARFALR